MVDTVAIILGNICLRLYHNIPCRLCFWLRFTFSAKGAVKLKWSLGGTPNVQVTANAAKYIFGRVNR